MTSASKVLAGFFLALNFAVSSGCSQDRTTELSWPASSMTTRPWAYWWWMGSAVDKENITKELERFAAAGMGGVHIVPIYGARGYESRYIEYLSPKWMEMLKHTCAEAQRLGMGIDMSGGSGWCFGGPNISLEEGGLKLSSKSFSVPESGRLREKLDPGGLISLIAITGDKQTDIKARLNAKGELDWTNSGPAAKAMAVWAKPTKFMVKRAGPGGEGPMLNPFSRDVMTHYLERFTKAFDEFGEPRPRAVYHDSYEYYNCDFSKDLLEQFEKRRGYRLQDHWVAFFEGKDESAARLKCDYRETVSDMMVDRSMPAWIDWAHNQKFITRYQAHGSPANLLDLYSLADVPETEMFHKDREILISKFASSAAHVTGRNLVASETGTWLAEHFTETLGDMKNLVDDLFLSGVNHVVYHGSCFSPEDAPWPGWCFYASTQLNSRNSIWHDVPALNAYVSRCQTALRSGRPDNDVLVYWPIHDLWHNAEGTAETLTVHHRDWLLKQPVGELSRKLLDDGIQFDFISDRQIAAAKCRGGQIETPGGKYKTLVVPRCRRMPEKTLVNMIELAKAGATIIVQDRLPDDVPGMFEVEKRQRRVRELTESLGRGRLSTGEGAIRIFQVGRGRVSIGHVEQALLAETWRIGGAELRLIRRALDGGKLCFIANHAAQAFNGWGRIPLRAKSAALMCPMTGKVGVAAIKYDAYWRAVTDVYLQIDPGQSIILRVYEDEQVAGAAWEYRKPVGETVTLPGAWSIRFSKGGPELPKPFDSAEPVSWTTATDPEAKRFAGTAIYSTTFDLPSSSNGDRWLLNLGQVCQSARVRINGEELDTLISPPFVIEARNLKSHGNLLEVEVTNTPANRIRDMDQRKVPWKIFRDINFIGIDYKKNFDASDWPVRDSGLLGPVTLQKLETLHPR